MKGKHPSSVITDGDLAMRAIRIVSRIDYRTRVTELGSKKMINFSITTLVKATYEKLNKYFVDHGTQADAMIASKQVYTLIVAKFINEKETKSNTHFIQQFDWQIFESQVKERVNSKTEASHGKISVVKGERPWKKNSLIFRDDV
ncbi:hypothetical protein JHK85_051496 [Glycine max]|nr:hypothetical protein JHK85_051496 [Glycine max]